MKDHIPLTPLDDLSLQASSDPTPDGDLKSLLLQAREGSSEAYRLLRLRYRPLVEASVLRYTSGEMSLQEKDDMREEAERVFLSAVSTFDLEQDAVDFGLYAKICLRNGLISEMRRVSARHRLGIVPLEGEDLQSEEDPGHALVEAERFRRLYELVRGSLSDFENTVWWMFVSGVSVRQISARVGKDERAVHNAIYRIRKKLRVLLADENE